MERQSFEGIEVTGEGVSAMVDAFRQYPSIVMKYLTKYGLISGKQGEIDRSAWYPLDNWLLAYQAIAKDVGLNSLYTIGKRIPESITLPPQVKDIQTAFTGLDITYHASHRKNGAPMFDPTTGLMLDGIGHYACKMVSDERKAFVIVDNPYPCELDRGIVTGFAVRFEPLAKVAHDNAAECRKKGAASCTYVVSW